MANRTVSLLAEIADAAAPSGHSIQPVSREVAPSACATRLGSFLAHAVVSARGDLDDDTIPIWCAWTEIDALARFGGIEGLPSLTETAPLLATRRVGNRSLCDDPGRIASLPCLAERLKAEARGRRGEAQNLEKERKVYGDPRCFVSAHERLEEISRPINLRDDADRLDALAERYAALDLPEDGSRPFRIGFRWPAMGRGFPSVETYFDRCAALVRMAGIPFHVGPNRLAPPATTFSNDRYLFGAFQDWLDGGADKDQIAAECRRSPFDTERIAALRRMPHRPPREPMVVGGILRFVAHRHDPARQER